MTILTSDLFNKTLFVQMPQEDYFKREIDKLGKVLAKALADLLNFKSANKTSDGIESVNEVFKTELNVTITTLLEIPENEFMTFLIHTKKLTNKQMELIADLLTEVADHTEKEKAIILYRKSLLVYKHVTENEIDYSVNRHYKIESLTNMLQRLNK